MNRKNKGIFIPALALLAICLFSTGCASTAVPASASAGSSANNAERDRRQQIFMNHIRAEGFVPSIDKDGDILFKRDGLSYYIGLGKTDPDLFQLLLPNIRELKSDSDRRKAEEAASSVNDSTKFGKVCIVRNNTWVSLSLETIMTDTSDFESLFSRMLNVLDRLKEKFEGQM